MSEYNKNRARNPQYTKYRRERWNKWRKHAIRKRDPEMEKHSKESGPRRFMTDQIAHIRRVSTKKDTPFDIDLDYVSELWTKQLARCAITGVHMTHNSNNLQSVRIDAIDKDRGYIKGNIQLICDGIKRMKKDMTNAQVKDFIAEIKSIIMA